MLDKNELEKKVDDVLSNNKDSFFTIGQTNVIKLKKFIWDYANKCWTDGRRWGESHGAD